MGFVLLHIAMAFFVVLGLGEVCRAVLDWFTKPVCPNDLQKEEKKDRIKRLKR